eukprot:2370069-Rhodomonas_salina.2
MGEEKREAGRRREGGREGRREGGKKERISERGGLCYPACADVLCSRIRGADALCVYTRVQDPIHGVYARAANVHVGYGPPKSMTLFHIFSTVCT